LYRAIKEFSTFRDFLEVDATFSYNNRKINWTGQENMTNSPERNRKTSSRAEKKKTGLTYRASMRQNQSRTPIPCSEASSTGAQYPTCTKNQYQKEEILLLSHQLDWLSFLLRCLSII